MIQKLPFFLGLDLNIDTASRTVTAVLAAESLDASRPARFCAVDAPSSTDNVSSMRGALRGRAQGQELLLSGSVSVHGVRTTDLSGEPSRHRGEPASTVRKALPLGDSRHCCPQHSRQRQCDARLAYLRELRREVDWYRTRLVRRGAVWRGSRRDGLRARCNYHRFVSVGFSMGAVSFGQSSPQAAYAARSARQYSKLYSHFRRQDARGQRARLAAARTVRLLRDGPWLPGLRAAVPPAPGWQFLRHARQVESQSRASGGSNERSDLRSNRDLEWLLFAQRISRPVTSHQVPRSEDRQTAHIPNQPVQLARPEHRRFVSLPLAGRAVLQIMAWTPLLCTASKCAKVEVLGSHSSR